MADVSKIKGTDNTVYNIKDATARGVTDTFNVITLTGTSGILTTAQYNSLNVNTIIKWKASSDDSTILYCINPKEAQLSYLYRGFSSDDVVITITILKSTRIWTKTTTTLSTSGHTHSASNITSGTFNTARIPDLDASKITSGTMAPARLDIAQNLNLWSIGVRITYVATDWYTLGGTCNNGYQEVLPNTTYTLSISESHQMSIGFYNTNKAEISSSSYTSNSVTFTTPANCYYIHINYVRNGVSISWAMLNKGSSALAYMPYIQNEAPKIIHSNGFTTISGVSDLINALNGDIGNMIQFMLVDRDLTDDTVILFPSIVLPKYPLVSGYLSGTVYMSVAGGTIAIQGRLYYYELKFNISYNSNSEMSVNSVIIYRAYNNGDRAQLTNGLIGYYVIS